MATRRCHGVGPTAAVGRPRPLGDAHAVLAVTARDPTLETARDGEPPPLQLTGVGAGPAGDLTLGLIAAADGAAPRWAGALVPLTGSWLPPLHPAQTI